MILKVNSAKAGRLGQRYERIVFHMERLGHILSDWFFFRGGCSTGKSKEFKRSRKRTRLRTRFFLKQGKTGYAGGHVHVHE